MFEGLSLTVHVYATLLGIISLVSCVFTTALFYGWKDWTHTENTLLEMMKTLF